MPAKISAPEKKRTVQTGLSATTVSGKEWRGCSAAIPARSRPSQGYEENPRPPIMNSQKVQSASASDCSLQYGERVRNHVIATGNGKEGEAAQQRQCRRRPGIQSVLETMAFTKRRLCMGP